MEKEPNLPPMNNPSGFFGENRLIIFRIFFFSVFLFLLYQLMCIFTPFFTPIMVAITLTLIFYPLHNRICIWLKNRGNLSAGISTGILLLIVIVPTILFLWILVREASVIYPWTQERIHTLKNMPEEAFNQSLPAPVATLWVRIKNFLSFWEVDPQEIFLKNIEQIGRQISGYGAKILKNIIFLIFEIAVALFTLFFFFRDGEKIVRRIVYLVPMESSDKEHILKRLGQTLSAVVRGLFITAVAQGLLAGLGYAVAGVRFSVVLGFATAFMALIPFVGAAGIWLPVGLYLLLKGFTLKGTLLILWGVLVVSSIDNFLKPILIGEKAKLPIFLLFFGILGGLQMYGFIGILMGPLIIASVLAFIKIYSDQMQQTPTGREDEAPPVI